MLHRAAGRLKGLTEATLRRISDERSRRPFASIEEFLTRVSPDQDEMQALIRAGAFDNLDTSRTSQYWEWRRICQNHQHRDGNQLLLPLTTEGTAPASRSEPTRLERLQAETELFGFPVSGHPLELHPGIEWQTYCSIAEIHRHAQQHVTVAGLIIEDRLHHQVDGRMMKFISICDPTGIAEVEIFADAYSRYGVNTVRYPVVEVEALVLPLESGIGCTLQAVAVRAPRIST